MHNNPGQSYSKTFFIIFILNLGRIDCEGVVMVAVRHLEELNVVYCNHEFQYVILPTKLGWAVATPDRAT